MNRDLSYLLDIYQYGQDAIEFVRGMSREDFNTDRKTQLAVIHCITIIGEATKQLSPKLRDENEHIPWKAIAGMRDKCVHDYRQINPALVWEVSQTDLPELLSEIEPLLPPRG